MARELTERQQKFLAVLMDEAGGDISTAKIMAGYSANTANLEVTNSLKEEIIDVTHSYLARNVPKAAMAMVGALYDPTELGIRDKMAAAKELLDRTGLVKTEKVQIEAKGGVMLMPAKNPIDEDECDCGKSMSACTCDD
jgi:phage terminase small subunit